EAMEQGTGLHSNSYTLAIIPTVNIAGTFGGQLFQDTFEPHLLFRFDKLHFYLVNSNPDIDPLNPSTAGLLQDPRLEANILSLLGLEFKVSTVRVLSLIGLGLSLCGALALLLFVHNMARHSQESLVQLKYGPMLVNVNGENFEASPRMIDIATIDDLAKLAERNNSMIFHNLQGSTHYYFVNNEGITYRCAVSEEKSGLLIISDMSLKAELQQGFERREFRVYYQPIVSLPDMKIVAVEALLRWQHPQRGLISASEFISVAEATGLIESLDGWMLQVACEHLKGWQKAGRPLELAVNLSDRLLEKDAKFISRVLHNTGVDANTLHIEIPEAKLIEKVQTIVPKLQELNELGVNISIDHFSGQFPLSSLVQLPVNCLKIGRPFLERIGNPREATAYKKMIAVAFSLGLNVVAEGVETEEQKRFLNVQFRMLAQGYLLGRPLPAREVTQLLQIK
ncbi:MAG: EAL domain-containing protein, partial [Anaerolineales bacterium]|nr:EAL domain-containing protein [Anaerolineales bacterium]